MVDTRPEDELNEQVVKHDIRELEKKLARYTVPPVGSMEENKVKGRCRILYDQMNNTSTNVVRAVKMDKVHKLKKYRVDVNIFF